MLKILTLNLHTYQEIKLDKFGDFDEFLNQYERIHKKIAQFIIDEDVDIIFFQEAAQHKDLKEVEEKFGVKIKKGNYIIELKKLLGKYGITYDYAWDWGHYGWDVWEEGLGFLSKFKIFDFKSKYVSYSKDVHTFYSRKVVKAMVKFANKNIDIFSVHFNWPKKGFEYEFENLRNWIEEDGTDYFIIAGDFNVYAGSNEYYEFINKKIRGKSLVDVFYKANPNDLEFPTIGGDGFNDRARIDYILVPEDFKVKESKVVFTDTDKYGKVSDHMGVFAEIDL
ncbi:MAG: endonuclease/exonuclease/phosphatase family protein [Thermosipho sp. (in: Bacteria)]|nr:endonuclease/exonuclease/phosphatase family protein [Thermosipho sp. (in: thermotogales)]